MINRKVSSYTLVEIMVVMLITTLIAVFCFMLLEIMFKKYTDYNKKYSLYNEWILLNSHLSKDFFNADSILTSETNNIVLYNKRTTIEYRFESSTVIRKEKEELTYHCITDSIRITTIFKGNNKSPVDSLILNTSILNMPYRFTHVKTYGYLNYYHYGF